MLGKVIIVAAPSGSGKTTLVKHLLQNVKGLAFSISATTRSRRENEAHGKDYYFIDKATFENKIAAGEFLEYEEVYEGVFYGSLKSEVNNMLQSGRHVIFDVDVKGAINIKHYYSDLALAIFIRTPSLGVLRDRLVSRQSESEESLAYRVQKARFELLFEPEFDISIVNDKLEDAQREIVEKVTSFLTISENASPEKTA